MKFRIIVRPSVRLVFLSTVHFKELLENEGYFLVEFSTIILINFQQRERIKHFLYDRFYP